MTDQEFAYEDLSRETLIRIIFSHKATIADYQRRVEVRDERIAELMEQNAELELVVSAICNAPQAPAAILADRN